jgi:endonuclease III
VKTPAVVTRIFDALDRHHPNADTELVHRNAFELLVATILSAQSTDARVNLVTPKLFERFPDARALAKADTGELEKLILSTGFFRQKSKSLIGMATLLL